MTLLDVETFLRSYGGPVLLMMLAWIGTSVYYGARKRGPRPAADKARAREAPAHRL